MASPEIIDFEKLLAPISDDAPAGLDLREDKSPHSSFLEIREAIKSARDAEQRLRKKEMMDRLQKAHPDRAADDNAFREEIEPPDWNKVYDLATETLATKSKDLWVAAWLIDALARLRGFAGLRDGFRLTRELCQRYWDGIHPRPADGNCERTVSQLTGLANGALAVPIAEIPIIESSQFRSTDYVDAKQLDAMDEKQRAEQMELGTPSMEMLEEAVEETSAEFFRNLIGDIDQALAEHSQMSHVLAECCGKNPAGVPIAPPATQIRTSLERCRGYVSILAEEVLKRAAEEDLSGEAETNGDVVGGVETGQGKPQTKAVPGAIESREEAFRTLNQLAKFFRKTEPLSPVSSALEQIVRWGDMSFSDLMRELIANNDVRNDLFRRTGVNSKEGDTGDKNAS